MCLRYPSVLEREALFLVWGRGLFWGGVEWWEAARSPLIDEVSTRRWWRGGINGALSHPVHEKRHLEPFGVRAGELQARRDVMMVRGEGEGGSGGVEECE